MRADLVAQFERSFSETAPPEEAAVFVVMGADDGTAALLSKRIRKKRPYSILHQDGVLPFAMAVNRGAALGFQKHPDADVLVIANNDLILSPGWYQALEQMISGGVEIVGAKLVYPYPWEMSFGRFVAAARPEDAPDEPRRIQHFGKWFSLDLFPFHVLRGEPETHEKAQAPMAFPDVTFALVGIRRDVWEALGGLDEGYSNGFEDDDFCLRAREEGAEIAVHPGIHAIHLESQTTGNDAENKQAQWRRFQETWLDTGRIQWPLGLLQRWRS